eukprot:m.956397 g.956397  ORF g.956397 m.956397 type:complete len:367 (+) comp23872_c0_seq50:1688-2788(+)
MNTTCFATRLYHVPVHRAYTGFVRAATFSNVAGSAFPVITSELIDRGGFSEIVAVIASCSAVAAVMSTADSTIIGANNVLTVEWGKHLFCPWATDRQLAYVSKVVCPVFAVGALLFSFASADMNFGTLMNLQGSFNWQTVPAFYVACFSDAIAAHPLLYGQLVGVMVCIALEIAAASEGNVGLHHNNTGFDMYIPSGLWGAMANVATVLVSQRVLVHIGSPLANDDTRVVDTLNPAIVRKFGPARLTAEFIGDSIIADTVEPMASTRNQLLCFAALFLLVLATPWYHSAYDPQPLMGGFVSWALAYFSLFFVASGMILYVYTQWRTEEHVARRTITHSKEQTMADETATVAGSTDNQGDILMSSEA